MPDALLPLILVTPILLLLALGVVGFVVRYQRRLLQQQLQIRQVHEASQQQALEAALLAQEEERRRIAGDLHDGVGTTLAIVKLHLNTLNQPALTHEATLLLDQAITEVRRISRNLLPAALQKFGLPFALEALARTIPADGPTHVDIDQDGTPRRLDAAYELVVYRIVQELLGNGLRHAHASHIRLLVTFGTEDLTLRYADDGIGFDPTLPDQLPLSDARTGLGLTNLRSRVGVLRGTLHHESAPGQGTTVQVLLPLPYLASPPPSVSPLA